MAELRPLGKTALRVSPLGLGCWQFSGGKGLIGGFWEALDSAVVDEIVAVCMAGGINWFDTAELYGGGASESALASALQHAGVVPGEVIVATKWSPFLRRASHIRRSLPRRIEALQPFPVDLHQIHQRPPLASVESQMHAMADLCEAGLVGAVGVSNFGEEDMRKAHAVLEGRGIPLATNQVRYSLLHRRIEANGVLKAATELGVTVIAYSPLAQGLLSGKYHGDPERIRSRPGPRKRLRAFRAEGLARSRPVVEVLRAIARDHGRTAAQVALNWTVHARGEAVVAIPGATSVRQARENTESLSFRLTDAEVEALNEVSRPFT